MKKGTKHWSHDEIEYIKENYGKITTEEMVKVLNRPLLGIRGKAYLLGLKSDLYIKKDVDSKNSSFNLKYSFYKHSAKKRGYSFELTQQEFVNIVKRSCFYCSAEPSLINPWYGNGKSRRLSTKFIDNAEISMNGIDRVDNSKGYSLENSVPCCFNCNKMKSSLTQLDFFSIIERIYANHIAPTSLTTSATGE